MAKNKKEMKELADLPYYREEYTAQLEKMGITDLPELLTALKETRRSRRSSTSSKASASRSLTTGSRSLEEGPEESDRLAIKEIQDRDRSRRPRPRSWRKANTSPRSSPFSPPR